MDSSLPSTFRSDFHDEDQISKIKYNNLGTTEMKVSSISFGASPLGNVYRTTDDNESKKLLFKALKSGINLIDTAPWYGNGRSETTLGKILEDVPRECYFLNTKVCRYEPTFGKMFDFSAEKTMQSVDESLERLNTDHIDVIQVHDMEFAPTLQKVIDETLPALQKMKDSGKIKHIGITGYPLENFKFVIERSSVKIDSVLTYCHGSLNDGTLKDYINFFQERGIGVINGSILSMGLLTNRGPPSWHPAGSCIKSACKAAAEYCQKEDVDISRIASDFSFTFPGVDTTLIGTASLKNFSSNFDVYLNGLSAKEQNASGYIIENFFKPLTRKDWDGVELEKYRSAMKEGRLNETL